MSQDFSGVEFDVAVIGGGAAGFFAAITCAEANPQLRVAIIEHSQRYLHKVRISGGGRCNVTHAQFDAAEFARAYPRGGRELLGALTRFGARETMQWFEVRGVSLKVESDSRVFPLNDQSSSIVNALLDAAKHAGVHLHTGIQIQNITPRADDFVIETAQGAFTSRKVLIASGGNSRGYTWARELGHTIETPVPSLFTFNVAGAQLHALTGIAVSDAELTLPELNRSERGATLITHWGLSGPAVIRLSAWAARDLRACQYQTRLLVNWLPQRRRDDITQQLHDRKASVSAQRVNSHSPFGEIPLRLWQSLAQQVGVLDDQRWAKISRAHLHALTDSLTQSAYQISGKGVFKEEFVICGGVRLSEVDFKTMQSRVCKNLYFAGEVLDVDGITGGFNLQNAWTTGWHAGRAMAQ